MMTARFNAEWLASATNGHWTQEPMQPVDRIVNDSRGKLQNALYVALRGERFDGHRFVDSAFAAGASAAMIDARHDVPAALRARPLLVVADCHEALSTLGRDYRLAIAPLTIGVTGSVGKSTVKEMCASVLGAQAKTAKTCGNWNNHIGLPLSLLAMPRTAAFGVFEVGMNHPGEIAPLCALLKPEWGVVTKVGPVHLEHFESEAAIAAEKGALLEALPTDGRAFLCCDDQWFPLLRKMAPCPVRTLSLENAADLMLEHDADGKRLFVQEKRTRETQQFDWPWVGRHNAMNAGFAILVGREAGLSWMQIAAGLSTYQPLPMRWQELHAYGCLLINDAYNANPESMRAAVRTFAGLHQPGRRWLVLGDMFEVGPTTQQEHQRLGNEVATCGNWAGLLTVGDEARRIADGACRQGMDTQRIWRCPDTHMATAVLREQLEPGDMVLFKASRGMALERIIDELGECNKEGV